MNVDWSTVGHAAVVDRRLSYLFNCFFQKKADAYVSFYLHWRILELDCGSLLLLLLLLLLSFQRPW